MKIKKFIEEIAAYNYVYNKLLKQQVRYFSAIIFA